VTLVEDLERSVDAALHFQQRTATPDERDRIVEIVIARSVPIFHAIALVLGTCCHCVTCMRAGGIAKVLT
jgi:uncharacterized membrane protein YdfJ with MMPL/SSD domain